jgi:hypothetical protein
MGRANDEMFEISRKCLDYRTVFALNQPNCMKKYDFEVLSRSIRSISQSPFSDDVFHAARSRFAVLYHRALAIPHCESMGADNNSKS